ncbi:MAG: ketoacyl-ACP synthase III [Gammaproteobacteria bacterium]|nr:ketoacyl-ACP synthase III [Gammaproteobacteria bacterium]
MSSNKASILGIGSYVPDKILTNLDLEKIVDTSDEWITSRTGIKERRIADDNQAASDLGYESAKRALKDAKMNASELDLIIVATISPDMIFPATACIIQEKLGAKNAAAFDMSAACTGFIYAITTAKMFIEAGMYNNILVIATEALSKFVDWEDRNTCVLFGDGSGAAVVGKKKSAKQGYIIDSCLSANGLYVDLLKTPGGGSRYPASKQTVKDKMHYLKMSGNEVFKLAVQSMLEATFEVLEKAKLKPEDIACFIPHQANIRIIQAIQKRLKVPDEKVYINVDKYGNTSAATVIIALDEIVKQGLVKKGDKVLLVAFGGGFTWGATIIQL